MEEQIKKLGEDFRMLLLHTSFTKKMERPWEAVPNKKRLPNCKSGKGATPQEALENLFNKINK